jgi:HAD superfamily hydrolase (TIGR01549 family)
VKGRPAGRLEAVTFDYWQTLMTESSAGQLNALRRAAWAAILADAGVAVRDADLRAAFDRSWSNYVSNWAAGRLYTAPDAAADVIQKLGVELSAATRAALIDAMVSTGADADLGAAPGIGDALRRLKRAGLRIGIVCDVGMTGSPILLEHLERHGLLRLFDHWSFSDVVGWYKPDRRIFEHALAGLGVDAARVAHVGDRKRTDVGGALGMGMTAVRYTGLFDDPAAGFPEADHVVASHDELASALGLA